jgi:hypothetical protein
MPDRGAALVDGVAVPEGVDRAGNTSLIPTFMALPVGSVAGSQLWA